LLFAGSLVWLAAGGAAAQSGTLDQDAGTPVVQLLPSLVQLGSTPVRVELQVTGAPPTEAFEVELSYDGDSAIVTAVEVGGFLASPEGLAEFEVREAEPGHLTLAGALEVPSVDPEDVPTEAAGGPDDPAGSEGLPGQVTGETEASLPSGDGILAFVTLAALAKTEGAAPIVIAEATLRGADGTVVDAETLEAQLTVIEDPSPEAREQALAQAAALEEQAAATGGLAGTVDSIAGAVSGLERRAAGLASGTAPQLVWLGILALALAVVGVAWYFGRRPAGDQSSG